MFSIFVFLIPINYSVDLVKSLRGDSLLVIKLLIYYYSFSKAYIFFLSLILSYLWSSNWCIFAAEKVNGLYPE